MIITKTMKMTLNVILAFIMSVILAVIITSPGDYVMSGHLPCGSSL